MFTDKFDAFAIDGDTIETVKGGLRFVATIHHDSYHGAPWDNEDGHGPVTDWETRDKAPGELILNEDGNSKRFYDFQEACRIALRDGWGFLPGEVMQETGNYGLVRLSVHHFPDEKPGDCGDCETISTIWHDDINAAYAELYELHRATFPSAKAYAAAAARRDFEVLKAWCNDEWTYCGVAVQAFAGDTPLTGKYDHALWGIEMNYPNSGNAYLSEVANELLGDCETAARERLAELAAMAAE